MRRRAQFNPPNSHTKSWARRCAFAISALGKWKQADCGGIQPASLPGCSQASEGPVSNKDDWLLKRAPTLRFGFYSHMPHTPHTNTQTHGHTITQTHVYTNTQIHRHTDTCTHAQFKQETLFSVWQTLFSVVFSILNTLHIKYTQIYNTCIYTDIYTWIYVHINKFSVTR